jgi:hypothetical protein
MLWWPREASDPLHARSPRDPRFAQVQAPGLARPACGVQPSGVQAAARHPLGTAGAGAAPAGGLERQRRRERQRLRRRRQRWGSKGERQEPRQTTEVRCCHASNELCPMLTALEGVGTCALPCLPRLLGTCGPFSIGKPSQLHFNSYIQCTTRSEPPPAPLVVRPTRGEVKASIARRNAGGPLAGRLLCADISGGREQVPGGGLAAGVGGAPSRGSQPVASLDSACSSRWCCLAAHRPPSAVFCAPGQGAGPSFPALTGS